jgi:hypothetical protein
VKLALAAPDCMTFPCRQECCSAGCDVWPHERTALLAGKLASEQDFEGPYQDDEGDWLFRTTVAGPGCVFLNDTRGCRLHATGLKPEVCSLVPRSVAEADEMAADDMLSCRSSWLFS